MQLNARIFIAGHEGLVGSALVRELRRQGYSELILKTRGELELLNQADVHEFFVAERPDFVFIAAGKTGGVYANNTYRAEFIYENIVVPTNIIHEAFLSEVKKLVYFGCSAMYPKHSPQPMKEEHLLTGALEPTNEPFAIAKLAGMKLCESYARQYGCDFITVIPTNLYGLNQDYTPLNSLVIPALIARFDEAKRAGLAEVSIWGSGRPARDFLFSDDLADAAIFLMNTYSDIRPVNVGSGRDVTVREVAAIVSRVVGFSGSVQFDPNKPEGVATKLQDSSTIFEMGWRPKVDLEEGIRRAYDDYQQNYLRLRGDPLSGGRV